jgi:folate-binding protein YgfZ
MTAGIVAGLLPRDAVLVTGADSEPFLQGQISQDIEAVAPGTSAWSLVLAPQGKVDAWFRITRGDDGSFVLDTDAGFGETLISRLERFRLRVDVSFEQLSGWRMLAVRGERVNEADLDKVAAEVRAGVDWPGFCGIDLLGPDVALPPGLPVDGAGDLEVARIRAGWPAMGRELTERTIPAEVGGLVESSVSFTKGCYTGQELVARIDSRGGNVPRPVRLLEIRGDTEVSAGAEIIVDGKTVGEVTSVAAEVDSAVTVALGPVHRRVEPPAAAAVAGMAATVLATPATATHQRPSG